MSNMALGAGRLFPLRVAQRISKEKDIKCILTKFFSIRFCEWRTLSIDYAEALLSTKGPFSGMISTL